MILHFDADAFFASVLQRDNPKLRGKPLLALGMGGGCVIAASYEAKRMGVKTGMTLREAKKLVPNAHAMPSDFRATCIARDQLFAMMERFCPGGVEKTSVDEGYLDLHLVCRGVACYAPTGEWRHFSTTLQNEIHRSLALSVSIGIAPTKTLAKMGSKHNKPKGICIIEKCDIQNFLKLKAIDDVPGFGARLTPKLQSYGFMTALDIANAPQAKIQSILGKTGIDLQSELNGIPVYAIITDPEPPKSISRCRSFHSTSNRNFLYSEIITHLERCSLKMRTHGLECGALGVWLRGADYSSKVYAERKFGQYFSEEALLIPFARQAFEEIIHTPRRGLACQAPTDTTIRFTQTGLVLSDFRPSGNRQISLFEDPENLKRINSVQRSVDTLRKRYGKKSVGSGSRWLA